MEQLVWLDNKKIDISGPKGNAFALIGIATSVLRQCGVDRAKIKEFENECFSGDYDHLCKTVTEATGIQLVMGNDSEYL